MSNERLCACGHTIWDHEDAEGGTHECNFIGCDCLQFVDAEDPPTAAVSTEGEKK